jgi:hypothetical protein
MAWDDRDPLAGLSQRIDGQDVCAHANQDKTEDNPYY